MREDRPRHLPCRLGRADIAGQNGDPLSLILSERLEEAVVDRPGVDHDAGAGRGKTLRDRETDAAGCAGHQGHPPGESNSRHICP